jgi:hypothetical protein
MSGDRQTGANQLATLIAQQKKGLGFSPDPADYQPTWIKLSGREFNDADPHYRPELNPDTDFLVGDVAVGAEGVSVTILGILSGHEEKDRVIVDGRETRRHFAFWGKEPKATPVKGKGGGLKTARGGWLTGRFDEIFVLINGELCVLTLYDMHHLVAKLSKQASTLSVGAMVEIKWRLTKKKVPDGPCTRYEPRFELIGLAGEADGPSEAETAQAKKLTGLIAQLSHPLPDVPLKLDVGGEWWEDPRPSDPSYPRAEPPDDGPPPPEDGGRDYGSEIPF